VAREDENRRLGPGERDQATEGRIDGDVHVANRITDRACRVRVVTRVLWVVQMPAVMTNAMALREDRQEREARTLRNDSVA
jgi:hypothetical protein